MMKKTLTVCLLASCFMTGSAYAQISANPDLASDSVSISGTVSYDDVQVVLIKPGYDVSDAENAAASEDKSELENVIEYFGQVSAKDKSISTVIPMRAEAAKGKYLLIVGDEISSVYFAHLAERQTDMVAEAKNALSNNNFAEFAANNGRYFCDSNMYDSLNSPAKVTKYAEDIIKKYKNLNGTEFMQKLSSAMNAGIMIEALNENKISDFSVIKSMTDNSGMKIPLDEADRIEVDKIKNVISDISGKNLASADAYLKSLSESIFINVILNGADMSNEDKKAFFETYAGNMGISLANYNKLTANKKAEAIAKTAASSITSLSVLQSTLDDICKSYTSVTTRIGGGSGGGGGGGTANGIRATSSVEESAESREENKGKGLSDLSQCEWARAAVEYLVGINMISGYEDNSYKPLKNISRAEFTSIIARKYLPKNGYKGSFSDIANGSWYADYVESAYTSGIVSGRGGNAFAPDENISRQDMAVILVRLAGYLGHELSGSAAEFTDDADIADYAKTAVYSLRGLGVINGDENGRFNPNAAATRAEAAQMIYGFIRILE